MKYSNHHLNQFVNDLFLIAFVYPYLYRNILLIHNLSLILLQSSDSSSDITSQKPFIYTKPPTSPSPYTANTERARAFNVS